MSVSARLIGLPEPLPLLVRPGALVERQDEPSPGVRLVESGALWERVVAPDGRELLLAALGPGDAVGEPAGTPAPANVRAIRPCRLRSVGASVAAELLALRARRAATLASELAWLDVPARVSRRLHDLATRFGQPVEDGTLVSIPLTQEELAGLAGTTRESANRAVRVLVDRGCVRVSGRGRYVIRPGVRRS